MPDPIKAFSEAIKGLPFDMPNRGVSAGTFKTATGDDITLPPKPAQFQQEQPWSNDQETNQLLYQLLRRYPTLNGYVGRVLRGPDQASNAMMHSSFPGKTPQMEDTTLLGITHWPDNDLGEPANIALSPRLWMNKMDSTGEYGHLPTVLAHEVAHASAPFIHDNESEAYARLVERLVNKKYQQEMKR